LKIVFVTVLVALIPITFSGTAAAQVSSSSQHKSPISKPPAHSSSSQQPDSIYNSQPVTPPKPPVHVGPDIKATDAERAAITFVAYDLDVRLVPAQQSIAVRALLKVRNDSEQPIVHLPLQISSSLEWETVRIGGDGAPAREAQFGLRTINSDVDHTGQLREAIVVLPQPLAPGKVIALDVIYRGVIELTGKRLEAIGTPADTAERSDWDRISPEFTGLRGFGNVAWYPGSSPPVLLGDGAKFFTEAGQQKQRQMSATVQMKVSIEYLRVAPNLAVLDGRPVVITAADANRPPDVPAEASGDIPLIATCSLPPTLLGFASPSIFIANSIEQTDLRSVVGSGGPGLNAYLRKGDELNIDPYLDAMAKVTPLLQQWLGTVQKSPLTLVDLPEPDDAPFEAGSVLLTPLRPATADQLSVVMIHALAHSYFRSPREWLNEGVPYFLGTLWMEKSANRDTALQQLDDAPLALAEPASPADADGQDLLHATTPIYYRSKAASVLWMLRDLVGDEQLSAAFRDYDPASDTDAEYFERLLERAPRDGSPKKDLKWLFDDWVYHDRGLPDLSIESAYPSQSAAAGSYIVAVNLANDGYAAADVPVTVRSDTNSTTERVRIPARSKITHRILVEGFPVEVTLNDGSVPEGQSSRHSMAVGQTQGQH
jgi:hypothetical protein